MLICAWSYLWPARWHGRDAVLVLVGAISQAKTAGLFSDQESGEAIVAAVAAGSVLDVHAGLNGKPVSHDFGMRDPGRACGRLAEPDAADQAGQHEQAAQAAGGDHGDRAARAGPGQAEPDAEDRSAVEVRAAGRSVRQAQGAAVPGCPGAARQRQPGGRHRHRGAENGEQVPAAQQQRLVDGGVVAEAAAGDEEPEGDPDPDGAGACRGSQRTAGQGVPGERDRHRDGEEYYGGGEGVR